MVSICCKEGFFYDDDDVDDDDSDDDDDDAVCQWHQYLVSWPFSVIGNEDLRLSNSPPRIVHQVGTAKASSILDRGTTGSISWKSMQPVFLIICILSQFPPKGPWLTHVLLCELLEGRCSCLCLPCRELAWLARISISELLWCSLLEQQMPLSLNQTRQYDMTE